MLIAHLGMSGSFRIEARRDGRDGARRLPHGALARTRSTTMWSSTLGRQRTGTASYIMIRAASASWTSRRAAPLAHHPFFAGLGVEPTGNCLRRRLSCRPVRRQARAAEGGAARPARHCRARQYLCLRSAVARQAFAAAHGRKPGAHNGRPTARLVDLASSIRDGDRGGDRGRRLVAARPHPDRRDARLFPAFVSGLRPRGRGLPPTGLRRIPSQRIVQGGRSTFYCAAASADVAGGTGKGTPWPTRRSRSRPAGGSA